MKKGEKRPDLQRARIANCHVCNIEFRAINDSYKRKQKYCSKDCWAKRGSTINNHTCLNCGIIFQRYGDAKYCSRECSHIDMIGEKSTRWIDGKSLERDRARLGGKLKQWRKSVYQRDNYTCQKCGEVGKIHAHHKIEWAKDETKRFDVDNGITFCVKCHGEIHGKDFTKRDKKKCPVCGKFIKRESEFCHSCSAKKQWQNRKILPSNN